MKQDLTYWAPASKDEYNQVTYAAPVVFKCRWEDKNVLFRSAEGQELTSSAIIYPASPLVIKGYVKKGKNTDLNPVGLTGAFEIRQSGDSPNLRNTQTLNKVFV